MKTYTVQGTYGASQNPCDVFVYRAGPIYWYAVEGSVNCNATFEEIADGVDVETLSDIDAFTASMAIDSEEALEQEVEE